jgi:peptidoglycan/xylan/chitin deacetylase (PgdA/CDA1 family)
MTPTMLTPTEVEDRFEEAARTLRRLPGVRVPGYFSTWPPVVRAAIEAYGYENAGAPIRIAPTPQAITRMEETFTWLTWLSDPDDMRIVWLRAEGVRWKPICWRIGVSRATAWRRWAAAMITIANRHNSAIRNPPPKLSQKKLAASDRKAARSARF